MLSIQTTLDGIWVTILLIMKKLRQYIIDVNVCRELVVTIYYLEETKKVDHSRSLRCMCVESRRDRSNYILLHCDLIPDVTFLIQNFLTMTNTMALY